MHVIGQREVNAVAKVIRSGKLFRYHAGGECERFEQRYTKYVCSKHCVMTSSGTTAITAALAGLGVGPGDEVLVPAHTFMASAVSVLAAGAIPVIVDIDDSLTINPDAIDEAVGPCTRAVLPVHMWGLPCDMKAIMRVARKHKLLVIEDACQAVGGGYEGKKLGSIGHAGAFSFNYFKNMTCGEGGAVVSKNRKAMDLVRCMIDCCGFYWKGRKGNFAPFTSNGSRASEIEGAIMNVQLDRIDGIIRKLRGQKKRILRATNKSGLTPIRHNSLDHECGTHVFYTLPTEKQATQFAELAGCGIAGKTGRHVYTEWDPIFAMEGAHHPAMNPFKLRENRRCRKKYSKSMLKHSLDILNRTAMIGMNVNRTKKEVDALIRRINDAAAKTLG